MIEVDWQYNKIDEITKTFNFTYCYKVIHFYIQSGHLPQTTIKCSFGMHENI
jgi:hypothetical protein